MSEKTALMLGDVCADAGIRAIVFMLKEQISKHHSSIVIANGENSDNGYGISSQCAAKMFESGVNVITGGNHSFDNTKFEELYQGNPYILRPANFPAGNAGNGSCIYTTTDGLKIGVINLHTPSGINIAENLYTTAEKLINKICKSTNIIFVDLHGEYSCQKEAFAFEFDGRITAVCGSHTHTQTMDEKILPKGTAYITDMGMCGVKDSVIGGDIQQSIQRITSGVGCKISPLSDGQESINGVCISFDTDTGKATKIIRL